MGQYTVLIFCLILIGIVMYFWQRNKTKKAIDESASAADSQELHLENVRAGGLIHLMNVGPSLEEYDVQVLSRSIYREGENYEWYELEGDNGKSRVWLSLQHDDGLDVTIATRKLKMRDLPIDRADLDRMDEAAAGQFDLEGTTFYYDHSTEGSYFQGGTVSPENEEFFYYWEFETEDEDQFLTVEEWENGRFEVTLSYPVNESQIKIYSLDGTTTA